MDATDNPIQVSQRNITCRKLLSERAKQLIRDANLSGKYAKRKGKLEPPYMAPSDDPDDYSNVWTIWCLHRGVADTLQWCSFCKDFSILQVLCAGCRIGLCVRTKESPTGCLRWEGCIEDPDFIYYCPYCAWTMDTISSVGAGISCHDSLISTLPALSHGPGGPIGQQETGDSLQI